MDKEGINAKVMIQNVQVIIDEEEMSLDPNGFDYNKYNTYEMVSLIYFFYIYHF